MQYVNRIKKKKKLKQEKDRKTENRKFRIETEEQKEMNLCTHSSPWRRMAILTAVCYFLSREETRRGTHKP